MGYAAGMPPLLSELLAVGSLELRLLAPPAEVEVTWAHGSDLEDPSPFLEPGQLLLTTGTQFADDRPQDQYLAYVRRLRDAGAAAIGFGTEVVRSGTPAGLVQACIETGFPLLEVPYRTPFIAIGRWIAARQAADARSRVDWALATQSAISTAAVSADGLDGAVARAAQLLQARLLVLDPDLEQVAAHPAGGSRAIAQDARNLLRAGRRAAARTQVDGDTVLIRTLGQHGRLRGVLAVRRATPFDDAELSAITTLTALAEVSLEHSHDILEAVHVLLRELFGSLRDGRVAAVRGTIRGLPAGLPAERFVVVATDRGQLPAGTADTLARQAARAANRTFLVDEEGRLTLLVDLDRWPAVRTVLAGARAGVSDPVGWEALDAGIVQARRAFDAAPSERVYGFGELVASSVVGLLAAPAATEIAVARVQARLGDERGLLREAAVWLRHNGAWDPAARELGLHRHSLKARMLRLGEALDLDLDRFAARAELWAVLAALGLADAPDYRAGREGSTVRPPAAGP